jgi:hypothetical protein
VLIGAGVVAIGGVGLTLSQVRDMGSMEAYEASARATRTNLSRDPDVAEFVRMATLAPNGHNTQPWRFQQTTAGAIVITPDFARRTPVVDPDDHHVFASLGCAAENLSIAAAASERPGEIVFDALWDGSVRFEFGGGPAAEPALAAAIPKRQSTRADYDGRIVSAEDLRALTKAAEIPGVDVVLVTERPQIARVRDLERIPLKLHHSRRVGSTHEPRLG